MVYTLRFLLLKMQFFLIILKCLFPILFTFYIQGVLKLKKNNSGAKRLISTTISKWSPLAAAVLMGSVTRQPQYDTSYSACHHESHTENSVTFYTLRWMQCNWRGRCDAREECSMHSGTVKFTAVIKIAYRKTEDKRIFGRTKLTGKKIGWKWIFKK